MHLFQAQRIFSFGAVKAVVVVGFAVMAVAGMGCNATPGEMEAGNGASETMSQELNTQNGLDTNGITSNGITSNGLNTTDFSTWFNGNSYSPTVMKYIVRCAYPAGSSLTWTNPVTGTSYTWEGNLGLTPSWAAGNAATETEIQLISACLAAHTNAYGTEVEISILGRNAAGNPIGIGSTELSDFSVREGCFFGDLSTSVGVHSGSDRVSASTESSLRACALSTQTAGVAGTCAPMVYEGSCSALNCVLDSTGTWYETCYLNGKAYRPLTTRVRPAVVYQCGDGVCQSTEHCGTGNTPSSCQADCGTCP